MWCHLCVYSRGDRCGLLYRHSWMHREEQWRTTQPVLWTYTSVSVRSIWTCALAGAWWSCWTCCIQVVLYCVFACWLPHSLCSWVLCWQREVLEAHSLPWQRWTRDNAQDLHTLLPEASRRACTSEEKIFSNENPIHKEAYWERTSQCTKFIVEHGV